MTHNVCKSYFFLLFVVWTSYNMHNEELHNSSHSFIKKVKLSLYFNWAPCHKGILGEWSYSSTHSLTLALDGGVIFRVFWKSIHLWFCQFVSVLFVLLLLHLSVCFVTSWLIPHPTIAITNLWTHGVHVCMHVYTNLQDCSVGDKVVPVLN
jgi:hypothetical protein